MKRTQANAETNKGNKAMKSLINAVAWVWDTYWGFFEVTGRRR